MEKIFLTFGLLFPIISWVSIIITQILWRYKNKYSSALLTPLIGPIFLNIWMCMTEKPAWLFFLPWLLDIGTIPFLLMLPRLIRDEWSTSRFTKLFSISSTKNKQTTVISFHKGGKYFIKFRWERFPGELGIIATNDFGDFTKSNNDYILTSHTGNIMKLTKVNDTYHGTDSNIDQHINLDGMRFK